jgi:hypothetical protein
MNIYQRLNEVRKAVSYVQKTKEISMGGKYMVVTHDEVTAAVRNHLVEQGVIVCPKVVSSHVELTGTTTGSGVPIIRYEARYDICFVNCDEPEDSLVMPVDAHALDQGDKAPGKAISYATKYALLKVFSIETGEAEEERLPAKGNNKPFVSAHKSTDGAWDSIPKDRQEALRRVGNGIIDYFAAGDADEAYEYLEEQNLSAEEKIAVWTMLDSKQRSALKKLHKERTQPEVA